ncbi:MAG: hypothetical protein V4736_12735 [Bdellovibrionota bacterium]
MAAAPKSNEDPNSLPIAGQGRGFEVRQDAVDFGRNGTLRYNVLTHVLEEKYDHALKFLKDAMTQESEYPDFKGKTERYFSHCIDLVYAIKAKRNFPGINSLTRAKQQELREKFKFHLKELQAALGRIEQIEQQLKIVDIRSTVYIIRALWIAGILIIAIAFAREIATSIASSGVVVADDLFEKTLEWLFKVLNI